MEFFGRPQLPTGLAEKLLDLQAQQPNHWAEAIKAIGGTVTSGLEHKAKLDAAKTKLDAQKSVIDYLQHHIGLRNKEAKMADIIKQGVHEGTLTGIGDQLMGGGGSPAGNMPWEQLPASTAAGPVGGSPGVGAGAGGVSLDSIYKAMGMEAPPGAGGLGFGPKRGVAKPPQADVVPLSKEMIAKFKGIMDLSGREGTPVKIGTLAIMNDMLSGKGKYKDPMDSNRRTAAAMAMREHMALTDEATYNPNVTVPDFHERTDYFENVLRNQGDNTEGGGLSDILMKSLTDELGK